MVYRKFVLKYVKQLRLLWRIYDWIWATVLLNIYSAFVHAHIRAS